MAIPENRLELLDAIDRTYSALLLDLKRLPLGLVAEKGLDGHVNGTAMSVHDLVSYLVGWNELALKWIAGSENGVPVDFPDTGFQWNELGLLAQKFYRDYDLTPFEDLLLRLDAKNLQIVSFVRANSNDKLYGRSWYKTYTLGRMIQLNTSSPYSNARTRLRRWMKVKKIVC